MTHFRRAAAVVGPAAIEMTLPPYDSGGDTCVKGARVIVRAIIRTNGETCGVRLIKAAPGCDAYAAAIVEAVARWRFKPALSRGEPIAIVYHLEVRRH